MTTKIERRLFGEEPIEIRESDEDPRQKVIEGYAAVFNSKYEDPMFIEVIRPGAFTRAMKDKHDVRALVDHDPSRILGRTKSNTLQLLQDTRGLWSEITLPDTSVAKDLVQSMKRGDIDGMSFGFIVQDERWGTKDGKLFREILDLDLFDVSVVTYPAYQATTAQVRSRKDVLASAEQYLAKHEPDQDKIRAVIENQEKYLRLLDL